MLCLLSQSRTYASHSSDSLFGSKPLGENSINRLSIDLFVRRAEWNFRQNLNSPCYSRPYNNTHRRPRDAKWPEECGRTSRRHRADEPALQQRLKPECVRCRMLYCWRHCVCYCASTLRWGHRKRLQLCPHGWLQPAASVAVVVAAVADGRWSIRFRCNKEPIV